VKLFTQELATYRRLILAISSTSNIAESSESRAKQDDVIELMRTFSFDRDDQEMNVAKAVMRISSRGDVVCEMNARNGISSQWMNQTGWLTAYAFDHTPAIEMLTFDVVQPMHWINNHTYDWILCARNCSDFPTPLKGIVTTLDSAPPYVFNASATAVFAEVGVTHVRVYTRAEKNEL